MATVSGDTIAQSDVLEDLSSAVNYRRWLCSLGLPHFGDDVLELGSGLGDYAAEWADQGVRVTASEADPGRLESLEKRFSSDPRVEVRELGVPIRDTGNYSTVVAYNVLEHIHDQAEALASVRRLLRPGGAVVLIVPAFEFAMSAFDRRIGHHRRYRKASLTRVLTEAGLTVEHCHYVNGPGLLAWYLVCKLLRGRPREGLLLSWYDRLYVPVQRRIEARLRTPFGQSLFAVARTPMDDSEVSE
ncbi:class I SAM-dependent methyltransferase [Stackebrandtia soli]|uniref:class I SAM-dependent methyltransferase n=1 Tax=Stackebrandtia soli TaxID=1892856 RepID=UPI0039EA0A91